MKREDTFRAALRPFAEFADASRRAPAELIITPGSTMARKQITMGRCYGALAAMELRNAPVHGFAAGIPWEMHLQLYDIYAKKYGTEQSAETVAARGGFGTGELDMFLPGWRDDLSELDRLRGAIRGAIIALTAGLPTTQVADRLKSFL